MPDDHSKLVPLLPISNRTVKRLSADDSADSRVKVGHRQAFTAKNAPPLRGAFFFTFDKWPSSGVENHFVVQCDGTATRQFIQHHVDPSR